jgi:hypothetical protein
VKATGRAVHIESNNNTKNNMKALSSFPETIRQALLPLGYIGLAGVFTVSDTRVYGRVLERFPEHQV